jgi:putative NADPH-quinone reductase
LCHALADAYARGAADAGCDVARIEVAALEFPWLRTKEEFDHKPSPTCLLPAQGAIGAADHLVIVYPLWLGTMPALLKAFLEQIARPGFTFRMDAPGKSWTRPPKGKSARIVVTMGMPALIYRWYYGAHSLKSLERNIVGFVGIGPIRESLFGTVEAASDVKRQKWLAHIERLGREARRERRPYQHPRVHVK